MHLHLRESGGILNGTNYFSEIVPEFYPQEISYMIALTPIISSPLIACWDNKCPTKLNRDVAITSER